MVIEDWPADTITVKVSNFWIILLQICQFMSSIKLQRLPCDALSSTDWAIDI
ncbi:uncharacterized protein PHALS_04403 [Plasmopara halstedii]|uniref:Uncharacterized protein n=1 Tax=Plasmopara halstedii TaxID=4781 RepID=A0A0P1AYL1_PLAHL|nr:uncharacterized protein PHALS_04403 [Plasmopara halstedii]CEG47535.1 hypothetical protein PHALS_04403 [Plasmopara halstedii]|eukprot:XP_024583904.1 hypothetical protein PHALS_04403 [Plasmopara halstedii]